jgi:hypothetical protein
MLLRRAMYFAQFPLAAVLPLWVLISRGIIADGIGLTFIVYLIACPVLFVALAVLTGLVAARKSVRVDRAVSWPDAAVLGALWISLVAYGFYALPLLATAIVLLLIGGFWFVLSQWVAETSRRVREAIDMTPRPQFVSTPPMRQRTDPTVIVVPPESIKG